MDVITDIKQLNLNQHYSYEDYMSWRFPQRVELIDGKVFELSPAPNLKHQRISMTLSLNLGNGLNRLDQKRCQVFAAPFDVVLQKGSRSTIVQPDICIICDSAKLTKQGCEGAPEIIFEILSPGNSKREMRDKFELYEMNGVLEYYIVDPANETIFLYRLDENQSYVNTKPLIEGDVIQSQVINGLAIDVAAVFQD